MKSTTYKRGKYNKQHRKEKKITFLIDKLMMENLIRLSGMKDKSVSQVIREDIQEYYIQTIPSPEPH